VVCSLHMAISFLGLMVTRLATKHGMIRSVGHPSLRFTWDVHLVFRFPTKNPYMRRHIMILKNLSEPSSTSRLYIQIHSWPQWSGLESTSPFLIYLGKRHQGGSLLFVDDLCRKLSRGARMVLQIFSHSAAIEEALQI
jgi:hypothetical protein